MKFSKKLEQQQAIAIFRGQWVAYRTLKHLIKDLARVENSVIVPEVFANQLWWFDSSQKASLGSISPERISFIQIVEYEINKTSQYYASQRKRIADMLYEIQRRLEGEFGLDCIMADIDSIAAELAIFGRFIWQAKQLLLKITKKHDKFTKYKVNTWFLVRLEKEEFWNPKIDELVIGISEAYSLARSLTEDQTEEKDRDFNAASEDFVRKNEKYFIKPEDVLLVKLIIVRHLPLDIFELSKLKKANKKNKVNLEYSGIQDNCVINSIYLDNDACDMYHDRTGLRGKKGNIIRIRWYGSYANPPSDCYIERKTRQVMQETAYYKIDEAIKERFYMNERNIAGYISGDWHIDKKLQNMRDKKRISEKEATETLRKATAIQDEIVSKGLTGSLRTVVRRSAFQRGGDQTLRFSLDTNLHIINEKTEMGQGKWARDLNMPLRFDEIKTLPYAILEVKTQAEPPAWVAELKNSGYLIPAAHFSKFLYGTAKLWPEKVECTPQWWPMLTELETTIPGTPALSNIHEKIAHFGAVARPYHSNASLGGETLHAGSSKDQEHKKLVEQMYGNSNILSKSLETAAHKEDKKSKGSELMTTKKSMKRVDTDTQGNLKPVTFSDLDVVVAKPTTVSPLKNEQKPKPTPAIEMKKLDKPKEISKAPKSAKARVADQRAAKVIFANERTLLSWLNTATFLSLTGVTLLTTETDVGRIAGVALTIVTVLFALYALFKYMRRLWGLKKHKDAGVMEDKYGPIALIACFCVTLLLVGIYFAINNSSSTA